MAPPPFPPGTRLADRYRPLSVIASGGMGLVVEAVDERLDRPVAVKLVTTTAPDEAARLRGEALSLARVRHRNVVDVYDAGEHDGRSFLVTELVRGESLRSRLDREGPMTSRQVAAIGADVARALECAHRAGVVHRDMKPANILVEAEGGRARLIDFGVASGEHVADITSTGMVVGTPAYLAPEQVEGRRPGPAVDVYAFGLVLIEALSGRTPFPGTTSETVAARLVRNPPLPGGLDQRWRELLSAMTSRDPAHRPAITEVASLLTTLARPDGAARDPGPSGPTELAGDRGPAGAALAAPIADGTGAGDPVTEPVSLVHGRTRRPRHRRGRRRVVAALTTASAAALVVLGAVGATDDRSTPAAGSPTTTSAHTPAIATAPSDVESAATEPDAPPSDIEDGPVLEPVVSARPAVTVPEAGRAADRATPVADGLARDGARPTTDGPPTGVEQARPDHTGPPEHAGGPPAHVERGRSTRPATPPGRAGRPAGDEPGPSASEGPGRGRGGPPHGEDGPDPSTWGDADAGSAAAVG